MGMGGWRVIITRITLFLVILFLLGLLLFQAFLSKQDKVVKERISFGEKSLIPGQVSLEKQAGIADIKAGKLLEAKDKFDKWLENNKNDPEARIFFNNANIGYNPSYTIAVSVPISKDINDINNSLEILRGIAQAQHKINDFGGIKGVRLKVAIASDENNPKVAQDVATALADNLHVLGVVGHYASDVTIAAKDIYTSKKLVAITPISTSVDLTKNSNSSKNSKPYIFRTVPSDSVTAKALADHMLQDWKKKNVAIFYNSDSNYSISLMSEFKTVVKQKGGQILEEFKLNEQNFNAALSVQKAIKKGTEVLMLAADTKTLSQALKVIKVAKEKKLNILAGDDVYTPTVLDVIDADGMVVAAFWHIDNAPNQDFVCESQNLWGKGAIVNWRTALAYDATWALIAAIERKPNPTQSDIQQALLSQEFKITGASGDIEFLPSGDRKNAKVELVQIVPNTNSSSTPYKFVPVAPHKDKPSSDCPGSPTNNSSLTPTSSPLPTATPTLTSTPTPLSSTTSLESNSVCRLQPESPELYKAYVVASSLNLRAEPRENSKKLGVLKSNQRIIILKENEDKIWQNVCEEGTNRKGWVKAEYTKKVVE